MFVKVKGLGGAGVLREPMDSNSSFPVILSGGFMSGGFCPGFFVLSPHF